MHVQPPTTRFPTRQMGAVADLSDVRAQFVEWLRDAGLDTERIDDLSVVLSELGANAIRETPDGAESAAVEASIVDGTLVVEVSNMVSPATSMPHDHDWDLADPLRTGGRGLLLVSAFVDTVDVDVVDRRLVVRCTVTV